jgi:hypothetical protein
LLSNRKGSRAEVASPATAKSFVRPSGRQNRASVQGRVDLDALEDDGLIVLRLAIGRAFGKSEFEAVHLAVVGEKGGAGVAGRLLDGAVDAEGGGVDPHLEGAAARGLEGEDVESSAAVRTLARAPDGAREPAGVPVGARAAIGLVDGALAGVAAVVCQEASGDLFHALPNAGAR